MGKDINSATVEADNEVLLSHWNNVCTHFRSIEDKPEPFLLALKALDDALGKDKNGTTQAYKELPVKVPLYFSRETARDAQAYKILEILYGLYSRNDEISEQLIKALKTFINYGVQFPERKLLIEYLPPKKIYPVTDQFIATLEKTETIPQPVNLAERRVKFIGELIDKLTNLELQKAIRKVNLSLLNSGGFNEAWVNAINALSKTYQQDTKKLEDLINDSGFNLSKEAIALIHTENVESFVAEITKAQKHVDELFAENATITPAERSAFTIKLKRERLNPIWSACMEKFATELVAIAKEITTIKASADQSQLPLVEKEQQKLLTEQSVIQAQYNRLTKLYDENQQKLLEMGESLTTNVESNFVKHPAMVEKYLSVLDQLCTTTAAKLELAITEELGQQNAALLNGYQDKKNAPLLIDPERSIYFALQSAYPAFVYVNRKRLANREDNYIRAVNDFVEKNADSADPQIQKIIAVSSVAAMLADFVNAKINILTIGADLTLQEFYDKFHSNLERYISVFNKTEQSIKSLLPNAPELIIALKAEVDSVAEILCNSVVAELTQYLKGEITSEDPVSLITQRLASIAIVNVKIKSEILYQLTEHVKNENLTNPSAAVIKQLAAEDWRGVKLVEFEYAVAQLKNAGDVAQLNLLVTNINAVLQKISSEPKLLTDWQQDYIFLQDLQRQLLMESEKLNAIFPGSTSLQELTETISKKIAPYISLENSVRQTKTDRILNKSGMKQVKALIATITTSRPTFEPELSAMRAKWHAQFAALREKIQTAQSMVGLSAANTALGELVQKAETDISNIPDLRREQEPSYINEYTNILAEASLAVTQLDNVLQQKREPLERQIATILNPVIREIVNAQDVKLNADKITFVNLLIWAEATDDEIKNILNGAGIVNLSAEEYKKIRKENANIRNLVANLSDEFLKNNIEHSPIDNFNINKSWVKLANQLNDEDRLPNTFKEADILIQLTQIFAAVKSLSATNLAKINSKDVEKFKAAIRAINEVVKKILQGVEGNEPEVTAAKVRNALHQYLNENLANNLMQLSDFYVSGLLDEPFVRENYLLPVFCAAVEEWQNTKVYPYIFEAQIRELENAVTDVNLPIEKLYADFEEFVPEQYAKLIEEIKSYRAKEFAGEPGIFARIDKISADLTHLTPEAAGKITQTELQDFKKQLIQQTEKAQEKHNQLIALQDKVETAQQTHEFTAAAAPYSEEQKLAAIEMIMAKVLAGIKSEIFQDKSIDSARPVWNAIKSAVFPAAEMPNYHNAVMAYYTANNDENISSVNLVINAITMAIIISTREQGNVTVKTLADVEPVLAKIIADERNIVTAQLKELNPKAPGSLTSSGFELPKLLQTAKKIQALQEKIAIATQIYPEFASESLAESKASVVDSLKAVIDLIKDEADKYKHLLEANKISIDGIAEKLHDLEKNLDLIDFADGNAVAQMQKKLAVITKHANELRKLKNQASELKQDLDKIHGQTVQLMRAKNDLDKESVRLIGEYINTELPKSLPQNFAEVEQAIKATSQVCVKTLQSHQAALFNPDLYQNMLFELTNNQKIIHVDAKLQIKEMTLVSGAKGGSQETRDAVQIYLRDIEQTLEAGFLDIANSKLTALLSVKWMQNVLANPQAENEEILASVQKLYNRITSNLAKQVMVVTSQNFLSIPDSELKNPAKFTNETGCPLLMENTYFNTGLANYIVNAILAKQDIHSAVLVTAQWIDIAYQCYQLGNFSAIESIAPAFIHGSLQTLLDTKEGILYESLTPELKVKLNELRSMLATEGSFRNMRLAINRHKGVVVPNMRVKQSDITFAAAKNPDMPLEEAADTILAELATQQQNLTNLGLTKLEPDSKPLAASFATALATVIIDSNFESAARAAAEKLIAVKTEGDVEPKPVKPSKLLARLADIKYDDLITKIENRYLRELLAYDPNLNYELTAEQVTIVNALAQENFATPDAEIDRISLVLSEIGISLNDKQRNAVQLENQQLRLKRQWEVVATDICKIIEQKPSPEIFKKLAAVSNAVVPDQLNKNLSLFLSDIATAKTTARLLYLVTSYKNKLSELSEANKMKTSFDEYFPIVTRWCDITKPHWEELYKAKDNELKGKAELFSKAHEKNHALITNQIIAGFFVNPVTTNNYLTSDATLEIIAELNATIWLDLSAAELNQRVAALCEKLDIKPGKEQFNKIIVENNRIKSLAYEYLTKSLDYSNEALGIFLQKEGITPDETTLQNIKTGFVKLQLAGLSELDGRFKAPVSNEGLEKIHKQLAKHAAIIASLNKAIEIDQIDEQSDFVKLVKDYSDKLVKYEGKASTAAKHLAFLNAIHNPVIRAFLHKNKDKLSDVAQQNIDADAAAKIFNGLVEANTVIDAASLKEILVLLGFSLGKLATEIATADLEKLATDLAAPDKLLANLRTVVVPETLRLAEQQTLIRLSEQILDIVRSVTLPGEAADFLIPILVELLDKKTLPSDAKKLMSIADALYNVDPEKYGSGESARYITDFCMVLTLFTRRENHYHELQKLAETVDIIEKNTSITSFSQLNDAHIIAKGLDLVGDENAFEPGSIEENLRAELKSRLSVLAERINIDPIDKTNVADIEQALRIESKLANLATQCQKQSKWVNDLLQSSQQADAGWAPDLIEAKQYKLAKSTLTEDPQNKIYSGTSSEVILKIFNDKSYNDIKSEDFIKRGHLVIEAIRHYVATATNMTPENKQVFNDWLNWREERYQETINAQCSIDPKRMRSEQEGEFFSADRVEYFKPILKDVKKVLQQLVVDVVISTQRLSTTQDKNLDELVKQIIAAEVAVIAEKQRPNIVNAEYKVGPLGQQVTLVSMQQTQGDKTLPSTARKGEGPYNFVLESFGFKDEATQQYEIAFDTYRGVVTAIGIKDPVVRSAAELHGARAMLASIAKNDYAARVDSTAGNSAANPLQLSLRLLSLLTPEKVRGEIAQLEGLQRAWHRLKYQKQPIELEIDGKSVFVTLDVSIINLLTKKCWTKLDVSDEHAKAEGFYDFSRDCEQLLENYLITEAELTAISNIVPDATIHEILDQKAVLLSKYKTDPIVNAAETKLNELKNNYVPELTQLAFNLAENENKYRLLLLETSVNQKSLVELQKEHAVLQNKMSALEKEIYRAQADVNSAKEAVWRNSQPEIDKLLADIHALLDILKNKTEGTDEEKAILAKISKLCDVQQLFYESQNIFFNRDFTDPKLVYELPTRYLLANRLIGNTTIVNCKSCQDRTGHLCNCAQEFGAFHKSQGYYPQYKNNNDKKLRKTHFSPQINQNAASIENTDWNEHGAKGFLLGNKYGDTKHLQPKANTLNGNLSKSIFYRKGIPLAGFFWDHKAALTMRFVRLKFKPLFAYVNNKQLKVNLDEAHFKLCAVASNLLAGKANHIDFYVQALAEMLTESPRPSENLSYINSKLKPAEQKNYAKFLASIAAIRGEYNRLALPEDKVMLEQYLNRIKRINLFASPIIKAILIENIGVVGCDELKPSNINVIKDVNSYGGSYVDSNVLGKALEGANISLHYNENPDAKVIQQIKAELGRYAAIPNENPELKEIFALRNKIPVAPGVLQNLNDALIKSPSIKWGEFKAIMQSELGTTLALSEAEFNYMQAETFVRTISDEGGKINLVAEIQRLEDANRDINELTNDIINLNKNREKAVSLPGSVETQQNPGNSDLDLTENIARISLLAKLNTAAKYTDIKDIVDVNDQSKTEALQKLSATLKESSTAVKKLASAFKLYYRNLKSQRIRLDAELGKIEQIIGELKKTDALHPEKLEKLTAQLGKAEAVYQKISNVVDNLPSKAIFTQMQKLYGVESEQLFKNMGYLQEKADKQKISVDAFLEQKPTILPQVTTSRKRATFFEKPSLETSDELKQGAPLIAYAPHPSQTIGERVHSTKTLRDVIVAQKYLVEELPNLVIARPVSADQSLEFKLDTATDVLSYTRRAKYADSFDSEDKKRGYSDNEKTLFMEQARAKVEACKLSGEKDIYLTGNPDFCKKIAIWIKSFDTEKKLTIMISTKQGTYESYEPKRLEWLEVINKQRQIKRTESKPESDTKEAGRKISITPSGPNRGSS